MYSYDYREAVETAVREWIRENDAQDMSADDIMDACYCDDSVTGNATGSYTCSRQTAREYIFSDPLTDDYLHEMQGDGLISYDQLGRWMCANDWESIDVAIRCYLLYEVADTAIQKERETV